MANTSIILSNLDFDTQKNTFKQFLRSQDRFKDYDFDGSNMNVLLDILSYNTYMNSFYLNMIGNEMFLDTALMRDSVVSHAKELNYVPTSFKSAEAVVNLLVTTTDLTRRSLTMAKGTTFTSRIGNRTFTFSTDQINVSTDYQSVGNALAFAFAGVTIYEGDYAIDTYSVTSGNNTRYLITNPQVDTASIQVTVSEDLGASVYTYSLATSLYDLTADSTVFFLQGAENNTYEIVFGDGVTGRMPKKNSIITIEYRVSSGELPNGCNVFVPDSTIDGESNIQVVTYYPAAGGSISESIESIKFNAPRHFLTQERAITTDDYVTLLMQKFPEVNTATAYGGETVTPPQFGKVFVCVDLVNSTVVPDTKKLEYYNYLKPRSPLSIEPVFVDADHMYISINSVVNYNLNISNLNPADIRTLVISNILSYAQKNLNNFNKTLRYSKLVNSIDNSDKSIVSNDTTVTATRYYTPIIGGFQTFDIDFGMELDVTFPETITGATAGMSSAKHTIISSGIIYNGQQGYIEDDGEGNLRIVVTRGNIHRIVQTVGSVDYMTGKLSIKNLKIDQFIGSYLKFYAMTKSKDIFSKNNVVLKISEADVTVTINQVRE
jgi:hypothetical protein